MVDVVIALPPVLADLTGCERKTTVSGNTVAAALHDLTGRYPALALHLFDDTGALRRHILCFRNEVVVSNRAELDQALSPGDRLTLVGSVAGG